MYNHSANVQGSITGLPITVLRSLNWEIVIYMLCGSPSWELWQATLCIQTVAILGIHFSVKWFLFSLWGKKCTIQTIWDKNMHILVLHFFMLVPPVNYGLSYFKNVKKLHPCTVSDLPKFSIRNLKNNLSKWFKLCLKFLLNGNSLKIFLCRNQCKPAICKT